MTKKIYEDKLEQSESKKTPFSIMNDEQRERGRFYAIRYNALKAEMQEREIDWLALERHYNCYRDYIEDAPNSYVPILSPIVNGQISSMQEQNFSTSVMGQSPSDAMFAKDGQKIADFIVEWNKLKQKKKIGEKRYLLFGTGVVTGDWDENALDGKGMWNIRFPQINHVFVDGNIKDITEFQKAEYVIEEIGHQSIIWARECYGDEVADALVAHYADNGFESESLDDEQFSFKLLRVWTRLNKQRNVQLILMDETGFIFDASDPQKPYWSNVENQYPFAFFGMYVAEGEFYRFGDGKELQFIQETVNKLYDEVITAIKYQSQGKILIDPDSELDPDDINSDPSKAAVCRDPNRTIRQLQGSGINQVVTYLIGDLFKMAQYAARFSALMTGSSTENMTATEAGIQTQQGNTGISDKKADISTALSFIIKYGIAACAEMWEEGMWMQVLEKEEFVWLDPEGIRNVPVVIPVTQKYREEWKQKHPGKQLPKHMEYIPDKDITDDEGNVIHKKGEPVKRFALFDVKVSIGEGLPTNKIALYNIMLSLANMTLIDEQTGQPMPVIGYRQFKKLLKGYDLNFDEELEQAKELASTMNANIPGMNDEMRSKTNKPINVNPNIPGANLNGTMIGGAR